MTSDGPAAAESGVADGAPDGVTELIQPTPLGNQVYHLLWQRIVSHQLRPGDKLSDLRLSEELGVSRTPVREALHRLAQEGVVRAASRRGFFVAHFSARDARDVYDVRTALEALAVRLALPRLTDDQIRAARRELDEVAARVEASDPRAAEDFLAIDRAFHRLLVDASGNRRLAVMMASLQGHLRVFQFYGTHQQDLVAISVAHHRAILEALERRDGPAAEQAMIRHLQDVKVRAVAEFADGDDE